MKSFIKLPLISSLLLYTANSFALTSFFIPILKSEVSQYCNPEYYTHWYRAEAGSDLFHVFSEIQSSLQGNQQTTSVLPEASVPSPYPTASGSISITPSLMSTHSALLNTSSSIILSTSLSPAVDQASIVNNIRPSPTPTNQPGNPGSQRERRSVSDENEPPRISHLKRHDKWAVPRKPPTRQARSVSEDEPETRILILLENSSEPYIVSRNIELNNLALGICTQPSSLLSEDEIIPRSERAQINISDDSFNDCKHPVIRVNDRSKLRMQSVHVDAHEWSSSLPVILLYERSTAQIHDSEFVRLKDDGDFEWGWSWHDFRATIVLDWWDYGEPTLITDNVRFYQGMLWGANIYAQAGGTVRLRNTHQVIANDGVSMNFCWSDVDIIGGSIVGCNTPVSLTEYAQLPNGFPNHKRDFCSDLSEPSGSCGYYSYENHINFQGLSVQNNWHIALLFDGDILKNDHLQNTGNSVQDFQGALCFGRLAPGSCGAVLFDEIETTCPSGYHVASSQLSASPQNDTQSQSEPPAVDETTTSLELLSSTPSSTQSQSEPPTVDETTTNLELLSSTPGSAQNLPKSPLSDDSGAQSGSSTINTSTLSVTLFTVLTAYLFNK